MTLENGILCCLQHHNILQLDLPLHLLLSYHHLILNFLSMEPHCSLAISQLQPTSNILIFFNLFMAIFHQQKHSEYGIVLQI